MSHSAGGILFKLAAVDAESLLNLKVVQNRHDTQVKMTF